MVKPAGKQQKILPAAPLCPPLKTAAQYGLWIWPSSSHATNLYCGDLANQGVLAAIWYLNSNIQIGLKWDHARNQCDHWRRWKGSLAMIQAMQIHLQYNLLITVVTRLGKKKFVLI